MATRSEYRKNYRNFAEKATEAYHEHLRYRQLRRSAEFAHHGWAWANIECEDTATPSGDSAAQPPAGKAAPTVGKSQLQATDLLPQSKRLTKAKPSLSTLSQSGSETDYEEREADLLDDPLASGGEGAAVAEEEVPCPGESAERAKIRQAIRDIKQRRQVQPRRPDGNQQQQQQQQQHRRRRQERETPSTPANVGFDIGALEDDGSSDYDDSGDTEGDYEAQLAAARRERLQRRRRQKLREQRQQQHLEEENQRAAKKQQQQQHHQQQAAEAAKKSTKQRRTPAPDCPPLDLDRVAEQSAQPLFHRQGQSQHDLQQQQQQQRQDDTPPIFYPWGMGDRELQYGLKRTFNVRATRDVYDSALRARARCPAPARPRPATAGPQTAKAAGGARTVGRSGDRAAGLKSAPARDELWLSEYAKNYAKYASALYARNRLSLASRSRADDLL